MENKRPPYIAVPPRIDQTAALRHRTGQPQPNPIQEPPRKPKIGLALGVAAVAGFLGGILWSKAKQQRNNKGSENPEPQEEELDESSI